MVGYQILASLFLGSSLGKIFSSLIIDKLHLNFFAGEFVSQIPSFNTELALQKTYDIVDFVLVIVFSLLVYLFNKLITKRNKGANTLSCIAYVLFSFVIFLQTHFATYSGKTTLLIVILFHFVLLLVTRGSKFIILSDVHNNGKNQLLIANGILTGFFFALISNQLITSVALTISLFALLPIIYLIKPQKVSPIFESHFHLILALSVFFPTNIFKLGFLGILFVTLVVFINNRWNRPPIFIIVYPIILIFLVSYNPLYRIGNLDTVEEGYWLGWLQRLINHQTLYKDVAVYHPPLILWGAYLFQRIIGISIANTRLFLHLLQIAGMAIYYFTINSVLEKQLNKLVVMLLVLSLTATMVKNNVEFRIGIGLLSLLFLSKYYSVPKLKWLIFSGFAAAVSLFTSLEVGLAIIITGVSSTFLFSVNNRLKAVLMFLLGSLMGTIPFILFLGISGSLPSFVQQLTFYGKAFSSGYFNIPIDRSISLSFIHWHIFNQYLSSTAWLWELARGGLIAALIYAATKLWRKSGDSGDKSAMTLTIFGLLIFRSALGRSDYYHLLFPLLVSLPLVFYVVEKLSISMSKPILNLIVALIFIFVFSRDAINANFVEGLLFRLQTYGRIIGNYKDYGGLRGGILAGEEINVKETDDLVAYIQSSTQTSDKIFVYPWSPELYFLTDRNNATKFDTPYAFFTNSYQEEMVNEIKTNKPILVIYNPQMKFAGMVPYSLPIINEYIKQNFVSVKQFGQNQILKPLK